MHGLGRQSPDSKGYDKLPGEDVVVPCGLLRSDDKPHEEISKMTLEYDEFIGKHRCGCAESKIYLIPPPALSLQ